MGFDIIVTTSERLYPPFDGANKKTTEIIRALRRHARVHIVTYSDVSHLLFDDGMPDLGWTKLTPRNRYSSYVRAFATASLATVARRRFAREAAVIRAIMARTGECRLLVDGVAGSPLAAFFTSGVMVSCNDCASDMFASEADYAGWTAHGIASRWRAVAARRIERKWLRYAERIHVLKDEDANGMDRVQRGSSLEFEVIPLVVSGPPAVDRVRQARSVVVWGNLNLAAIAAGLRALEPQLNRMARCGWRVSILGRISPSAFQKFGPWEQGIECIESTDDLDSFLSEHAFLIVPDVAGSGQKTRTIEGLRLGRCVVGFDEAFAGLPAGESGQSYIRIADPQALFSTIEPLCAEDGAGARVIGERGTDLFMRGNAPDVLGARWIEALGRMSPLSSR